MKKRYFVFVPVVFIFLFLSVSFINHKIQQKKEQFFIKEQSVNHGSLVDVGFHKLNVFVSGKEESPVTLVFMSGAGTCSPVLDFKNLYSLFTKGYKIAVVEKSGYGFSELGNTPRDLDTMLEETRAALKSAGILSEDQSSALVLFPHSMSFLEAIYWADKYPQEIQGIIALDGAIPQAYDKMKNSSFATTLAALALKTGVVRFLPWVWESSAAIKAGNLTEEETKLYKALFYNRTMTQPMRQEAEIIKENAKKVSQIQELSVPTLFFVSNGEGTSFSKEEWHGFFDEYAEKNSGVKITKLDCPHYVHNFKTEQIYADSMEFIQGLHQEPELLWIFKQAYPAVKFESEFDSSIGDWKIHLKAGERSATLYWAEGKFLPKEELEHKDLYSPFLYSYAKEMSDPKDFTDEDINRIKNFSAPENRTQRKGSPPFLYDLIYDCNTRASLETHIKYFSFLNKRCNAHEFIHDKLALVQADIFKEAESDLEVKQFIADIASADSYSWRSISDSGNRSFHSLGLAIDILPKGWGQKNIYWAWRRDIDPENWMMLDLDRRWMPPKKVVEIFESHGFLWGGKWIIWDNMHFEYRPEVILYTNMKNQL